MFQNLSLFLSLAKFAIKRAPETALALLKNLKPSNWKLSVNDVTVYAYQPSFDVVESFKEKRLVVRVNYVDLNNTGHTFTVFTRFKNDGSDALIVDGIKCTVPKNGFDFDAKPFKKELRLEIRFTTPEGYNGTITFINTL